MAPSSVEESEGYHVVLSESMKFIGFISEITTPQQVAGRFTVSKASCQVCYLQFLLTHSLVL